MVQLVVHSNFQLGQELIFSTLMFVNVYIFISSRYLVMLFNLKKEKQKEEVKEEVTICQTQSKCSALANSGNSHTHLQRHCSYLTDY